MFLHPKQIEDFSTKPTSDFTESNSYRTERNNLLCWEDEVRPVKEARGQRNVLLLSASGSGDEKILQIGKRMKKFSVGR